MRIGLLLGSFNPIHRAHVAIALWALQSGAAEKVWIVPTPQNPLKDANQTASFDHRVAMALIAVEGIDGVEVSTIESELSWPHYTINTIEYLYSKFPEHTFFILCGSDIIEQLPHWYRIDDLRSIVDFVEYPRGVESADRNVVQFVENSAAIRRGELLQGLDAKVLAYIEKFGIYFASAVQRARKAMSEGDFPTVINLGVEFPHDEQVGELAKMARDILAFRCTDIYNP